MIPILRQATLLAIVPANGQVFLDRRPAHARLARPTGIYFHTPDASALALGLQDAQEVGPANITDCPIEPAGLQHPLDVQAFDCDETKGTEGLAQEAAVL